MKLRIWTTLFSLTVAQLAWGQTSGNSKLVNTEGTAPETSATSYTVIGATPKQEARSDFEGHLRLPQILARV